MRTPQGPNSNPEAAPHDPTCCWRPLTAEEQATQAAARARIEGCSAASLLQGLLPEQMVYLNTGMADLNAASASAQGMGAYDFPLLSRAPGYTIAQEQVDAVLAVHGPQALVKYKVPTGAGPQRAA